MKKVMYAETSGINELLKKAVYAKTFGTNFFIYFPIQSIF